MHVFFVSYYNDIKWAPMHLNLNSPAFRLFGQQFVQAHIEENTKALHHWLCEGNPLMTGGFPSQRDPWCEKCFNLITSPCIKNANIFQITDQRHDLLSRTFSRLQWWGTRIFRHYQGNPWEHVCRDRDDVSTSWYRTTEISDILSKHFSEVIMGTMASQITGVSVVHAIVCSGVDQRKHQNSLASVRGIHLWPVNSPHKRPVTRNIFPFDYVIMFMRWRWFLVWCVVWHLVCI